MTSMRLYTVDEFMELTGEEYDHCELVRGVLQVRDNPPELPHAYTQGMLAYALNEYLQTHRSARSS